MPPPTSQRSWGTPEARRPLHQPNSPRKTASCAGKLSDLWPTACQSQHIDFFWGGMGVGGGLICVSERRWWHSGADALISYGLIKIQTARRLVPAQQFARRRVLVLINRTLVLLRLFRAQWGGCRETQLTSGDMLKHHMRRYSVFIARRSAAAAHIMHIHTS